MNRTRGITVKVLKKLVDEQVKLGNGDKEVLLSCDDEGNGYHTLFYGFTTEEDSLKMLSGWGLFHDDNDPSKIVILG